MSIKTWSLVLAFFSKFSKKEKTKEQYMQDIDSLLRKADTDYARKRIKTDSSIHEYEKIRDELLLSKAALIEQISSLEKAVINSDPIVDKLKNMESGIKILSLREIVENVDRRVGQIGQFISVAKEALVEQNVKHIEICTTLKIKKSDLISLDVRGYDGFDNAIINDIKSISDKIESDIDEMEISIQAEKIFSESISGKDSISSIAVNESVENILSELISRKEK